MQPALISLYKVPHRTHGNLAVNAPSVTAGTHTAFYSRLDPQHNTHLMFVCIAHPGSRLSERGEPREGVEAVDERLRRRAIVAADGVERIDAKELVNQAAGDAQHGTAAVLALDVQLVRLLTLVVVPHPRRAADVTRDLVILLLDNRPWGRGVANLTRAGEGHDLQPAERRDRLERSEAARRHIGKLEVLRGREVALKAHAGLDVDNVQEAKHGRAAVLDLHDLVAAHVAGLNQTQRVEKAQGRQNAQGAAEAIRRQVLLAHAGRDALGRGTQRGRGLEGRDRLQESKGSDGNGAHDDRSGEVE